MIEKNTKYNTLIALLSLLLLSLSFTFNSEPPVYLKGTWINHTPSGFSMIEIRDTNDITFTIFVDRQKDLGKKQVDRFWYYKSKASMGNWNNKMIWILTDHYRFDFNINGDSLIEFDKMGVQGIFIKVETDEQKSFKQFNGSNINGSLDWVSTNEHFTLNKSYFQFTSIPSSASDNKKFGEIAEVGDSIFKPAQTDTLILIKKSEQKMYKFPFVRYD